MNLFNEPSTACFNENGVWLLGQHLPLLAQLNGPLVWSGADTSNSDTYILELDRGEIEEIGNGLDGFKLLGLDGDAVSRKNFILPTLGSKLEKAARAVYQGRGFVIVRGLDTASHSIEDSVTTFLGIASYIGDQRGLQDRRGNMLSHVTSSRLWKTPVCQRHGIHTSMALPFHNDMGCETLALQVRETAYNGGHTYLSSTWTVFNDLLASEPGVLSALLAQDWPVQVSGQKGRHYLSSAFALHGGKLMASADPSRFGPHPHNRTAKIPHLSLAQEYALQRVSEIAHHHQIQLELEKGDILFINNWALLHRREAYEDTPCRTRHIVRLWLRNSQLGWPVPKCMLPPWLAAFGEGETRKTLSRLYPLVPPTEYYVPKYSAGSAAFAIEDTDESGSE